MQRGKKETREWKITPVRLAPAQGLYLFAAFPRTRFKREVALITRPLLTGTHSLYGLVMMICVDGNALKLSL